MQVIAAKPFFYKDRTVQPSEVLSKGDGDELLADHQHLLGFVLVVKDHFDLGNKAEEKPEEPQDEPQEIEESKPTYNEELDSQKYEPIHIKEDVTVHLEDAKEGGK